MSEIHNMGKLQGTTGEGAMVTFQRTVGGRFFSVSITSEGSCQFQNMTGDSIEEPPYVRISIHKHFCEQLPQGTALKICPEHDTSMTITVKIIKHNGLQMSETIGKTQPDIKGTARDHWFRLTANEKKQVFELIEKVVKRAVKNGAYPADLASDYFGIQTLKGWLNFKKPCD
tara:strand:- start:7833 stop:8348 length:516 start_codon:yes stop_codon:yes gene_type:complete